MIRRTQWAMTLVLLLAPTLAFASKREGVTMKDAAKVGTKKLVLNGMGVRQATVFNVNVYVAGLYLEAKTRDPKAVVDPKTAKKILFHFVRDVDLDDLQDAFEEGFEKNGGGSMTAEIKKLNGMMSDMKVGQQMSLSYEPGKGTTVSVLGKAKGVIPGENFVKVLLTIFVGDKAPNRLLRDGMLGKA